MYKYGNNAEHSVYKKVASWPRFDSSTMPFVLGHLLRQFSETFLHVCNGTKLPHFWFGVLHISEESRKNCRFLDCDAVYIGTQASRHI